MLPKVLAEYTFLYALEIISSLYVEHASGNTKVGIGVDESLCKNVSTLYVWGPSHN